MRLIDAEALIDKLLNAIECGKRVDMPTSELEAILNDVKATPSIDIVRCGECKKLRDCRHDSWQKGVIDMGYVGWCKKTSRLGDVTYVKDSDYCSYGERNSEKPNKSTISKMEQVGKE